MPLPFAALVVFEALFFFHFHNENENQSPVQEGRAFEGPTAVSSAGESPVEPPRPEPQVREEPRVEAAEDESLVRTVVVEASEGEKRRRSAEAVSVVELDEAKRSSRDLGDTLAQQRGLSVRRAGGLGSRMRLSINGLTEDQIRFFHNAVPLEYAGFGFGLANVPVNLVDRVEIHRGVVPLRFATDALGGAVELVTEPPEVGVHGEASYQAGSFNTHRLTAMSSYRHEETGVFVRASGFFDHSDNDYTVDVEVPDQQGQLSDAKVRRWHNAYGALGGRIEAGVLDVPWADRFVVTAYGADHDSEVQHNITMDTPYGGVTFGRTVAGANLQWAKVWTRWEAEALVGFSHGRTWLHDQSTCVYDWLGRCVVEVAQPGEINRRGYDQWIADEVGFGRVTVGRRLGRAHRVRATVAPTAVVRRGDDRELEGDDYDPLRARNLLVSLIAGLEHQVDVLDDRLQNIAFVKDYVQFAAADQPLPSGDVRDLASTSHGIGAGDGLRLHITPWLMGKASYEWALRLPRADEMFGDGVFVIENLELDPERSHNVNVTLDARGGDVSTGQVRLEVNGFARVVRDMIRRPAVGPTHFQHQNLLDARVLGVEASFMWTPVHWVDVGANASWQDARNTSSRGEFAQYEGDRLRNQPYLLANGAVNFHLRDLALEGDELVPSWRTRYVHPFFLFWESTGDQASKAQVPAQWTMDVGLSYVADGDSVSVTTSVEVLNLLDRPLFDFYGVQRMGRAAFGKVALRF